MAALCVQQEETRRLNGWSGALMDECTNRSASDITSTFPCNLTFSLHGLNRCCAARPQSRDTRSIYITHTQHTAHGSSQGAVLPTYRMPCVWISRALTSISARSNSSYSISPLEFESNASNSANRSLSFSPANGRPKHVYWSALATLQGELQSAPTPTAGSQH